MKGCRYLISCMVLGLVMASEPVLAAPDWSCLESALQKELERKLTFQDEFAEMVSAKRPEFADIARKGAETSKANFEMRYSRIAWLWSTNPSRFAEPDAFWSFAWSEDDMANWLEADPDNPAMLERVEGYQESLRDDPELADFRTYVSEKSTVSPYLELYTAFGEDIRADRNKVAICF